MSRLASPVVLALLLALPAPAPANDAGAYCSMISVSALDPAPEWWAVAAEKDVLDHVVDECAKPLTDLGETLAKIAELRKDASAGTLGVTSAAVLAADLQERADELGDTVKELALGVQGYVLKCFGKGGWAYLRERFPEGLKNTSELVEAALENHEKIGKAAEKATDPLAGAGTRSNYLVGLLDKLVPGAETLAKARSVWETVQAVKARPERLRFLETEVEVGIERAGELVRDLDTSCDVKGAQAELDNAVDRARVGLQAARLEMARAERERRNARKVMEGTFGIGGGGNVALEQSTAKLSATQAWEAARARIASADQSLARWQQRVAGLGGLCQRLGEGAIRVGERRRKYLELEQGVKKALESCDRDAARTGLQSLENLAQTECVAEGHLTGTEAEVEARRQLEELEPGTATPLEALRQRLADCEKEDPPPPTEVPPRPEETVDPAVIGKFAGTWYMGNKSQCWQLTIQVSGSKVSGASSLAGPFSDATRFEGGWDGGALVIDWTGSYDNPGCISCRQTKGTRAGRSTFTHDPATDTLHTVSVEAAQSQVFHPGRTFPGRWTRSPCR